MVLKLEGQGMDLKLESQGMDLKLEGQGLDFKLQKLAQPIILSIKIIQRKTEV